jgi:hypothetical protein
MSIFRSAQRIDAMLDDDEITEELEESLDLILAEITGMEEVVADASDLEIAPSDRVVITREIDALWDQGDALMSWLIEKPAREDN